MTSPPLQADAGSSPVGEPDRLDALTGVASRRAFERALARRVRDAGGTGDELCLLLADVDRFDACNDAYGHGVGDQVLRFVAQELDRCVKGRELLARFGGAAFVILVPDTGYHGALILAESIRAIIGAQVVETGDGRCVGELTISIGVARLHAGEDPATLVARADACLRQAKALGRNRVFGERDLRVL